MSAITSSFHVPRQREGLTVAISALARLERDTARLARRLEEVATDMQELLKTEARAAADPDARREQAGGGIAGLRALAGVGVSAVGALVVLAVIVVHQGLALPLSELPARPGLWPGLLTTGGGLVVMYTSRQTRRAPSKPEPPARAASPANAKPEASEQ